MNDDLTFSLLDWAGKHAVWQDYDIQDLSSIEDLKG